MPHQLIASPFLDHYLVVRPGRPDGLKVGKGRYEELRAAHRAGAGIPPWLTDAARTAWGIEIGQLPFGEAVLVCEPAPHRR